MITPDSLPPLSAADARLIDQICDRFEAACKAGRRPRLDEYLEGIDEPVRRELLRQLLWLDVEYARRAGESPSASDYQTRFPNDTALIVDICGQSADALSESPPRHNDSASSGNGAASRYEQVQEVGRGGIGVVFRVRDRVLGRELALKVLCDDYRDSPEARRRFIAEARIGSQLQHPAIVPVYETGNFHDGRPYLAMRLVEGRTLAELLHDRRALKQDLPKLLGVFEQVCQAMAYAHACGVAHRDLKPANVMVGAFGEVQVMDWGFAKVFTDRAKVSGAEVCLELSNRESRLNGMSESGALMGTPAYMPPEQARGDAKLIDSRADVFALGAMLCEILTGKPPYMGESAEAVCLQAAKGQLGDAYARIASCGADEPLRDLCRRCLASRREERPADAGCVAQELTNYLTTTQERLQQARLKQSAAEARELAAQAKAKAERRARRIMLALTAALLVGIAVASWQTTSARSAKRKADSAALAQKDAKDLALAKEAEARIVLDFVQQHIVSVARPEGENGGLGRDVSVRQALMAALPALDKEFADQPLVEAKIRRTVGDSFLDLGEPEVAVKQFLRARDIQLQLLGSEDAETLLTLNDLASGYLALGDLPTALKLHESVLPIREAKFGRKHHDTLQSLENLATTYEALGRHGDAAGLREEVLQARQEQLPPDHADTLQAMNNLANSYYALRKYDESLKLDEKTNAILQRKLGPTNPATLRNTNNLAISYCRQNRFDDARRLIEATLGAQRIKLGPFHRETIISMHNLAKVFTDMHHYDEAIELHKQALALLKEHHPSDLVDIAQCTYSMANDYGYLKQYDEALLRHREALALREKCLPPKHRDTLYSMWGVAAQLVKLGRGSEAIPIIDRCLEQVISDDVDPRFWLLVDLKFRHFERAKDAAGCRVSAEQWERFNCRDAESLYHAACFRAATAKVLHAGDRSPAVDKQAAAEAARAMAWLQKAAAAGYRDAAFIEKDSDFAELHDRPDFRKLVAELKATK